MMITKVTRSWRFFLMVLALLGLSFGCVEPMDIETGTYENALVVEGVITNELVYQEVLLSRTYRLEEGGASKESNAQVRVTNNANVYEFQETEPGRYLSMEPFRAVDGVAYSLEIITSNGRHYASEAVELPHHSEISSLFAQKTIYEEQTGVAILVDVKGSDETSGYYKYDFSETYKIVSPFSYPFDVQVIDGEFVEIPKTREEKICYTTEHSKEVLLANTNIQVENDLNAYLIRFIDRENFRTAHRYSILVRQYAISGEAYSYYETLKDFSESESLFAQNQLGLINGNLISVDNPYEPVIGIFSVAGVSSKRIFFDFENFYDRKEFTPNTHVKCKVQFPRTATKEHREMIGDRLDLGFIKYIGYEITDSGKKYRFIKAGCVDCNEYGTNIVPDFWEE